MVNEWWTEKKLDKCAVVDNRTQKDNRVTALEICLCEALRHDRMENAIEKKF